jgi:transcriptional regulator with XRE-family HTH domain
MDPTKFQQALERALTGLSQVQVARDAGVAASTVSTWLGGGGARPEQVFAVERALNLPPGHLSRHLGYVPVTDRPVVDVAEAIEAAGLPDSEGEAVLYLYSFFKRRSAERERLSDAPAAETRKPRKAKSRSAT